MQEPCRQAVGWIFFGQFYRVICTSGALLILYLELFRLLWIASCDISYGAHRHTMLIGPQFVPPFGREVWVFAALTISARLVFFGWVGNL